MVNAAKTELRLLAGDTDINAANDPDGVAIVDQFCRYTHREFLLRVNQVAGVISGLGLGPGDRLAVLMDNRSEFVEILYAAMRSGVILTPLNWRLSAREVESVLVDSGASALIVGPGMTYPADSSDLSRTELRTILRITPSDGELSYEAFVSAAVPQLEFELPQPDDVWALIYTGGTTGQPKGVALTHGSIAASVDREVSVFGFDRQDVMLNVLPLFHVAMVHLLSAVRVGGTNVIAHRADPEYLLSEISESAVTRTTLVPTSIIDILNFPDMASVDISSLKTLIYGGAAMPGDTSDRAMEFFGPILAQIYGMTEAAGIVTVLLPEDHLADGPSSVRYSVGRPLAGLHIECWSEDGSPVPNGEIGEIVVRGGPAMKEYWNQPSATSMVLVDGAFRTGDIGRVDESGYVWLLDRKSQMIITGGENVYPGEIENVLMTHPDVLEVAIVGVPDPRWGERIKAFAVVRPSGISTQLLQDYCRGHLAGYKVPKEFEFLDALPRTTVGKIDKIVLRASHPIQS